MVGRSPRPAGRSSNAARASSEATHGGLSRQCRDSHTERVDLITSSVAGALAQSTLSAAVSRARTSLGGEFVPEIRQILTGVQEMRRWLAEDRQALLRDGFSFILQDDLDAARRSLTQARNREPRSAVVRYWLSLVLAVQNRAGAEAEMREALELNPYLATPTTVRSGANRPVLPEGRRPVWAQHLSGREAGVTLGALVVLC